MGSGYDNLIQKLDAFIRKYYLNQIIRGLIYFLAIVITVVMISAILEYYGRFSGATRAVMFYTVLGIILVLIFRNLLIPGLKLFKLGSIISHDEASSIIGKHFPEVQDKLLNTLQLKRQIDISVGDNSLLLAGIDQKMTELKPVSFKSAVNFGENRKYLKYVLPPIVMAILLIIISPAILTEGTQRIVTYNEDFSPVAPFFFNLLNEDLSVRGNDDFTVRLEVAGDYVPSQIELALEDKSFRLKKTGPGEFSYTFRNVRNSIPFKFYADGFYSQEFFLEMLPPPVIRKFDVRVDFPDYLTADAEEYKNTGNLRIPEGSRVTWSLLTQNTEKVVFILPDTLAYPENSAKDKFEFSKHVFSSFEYRISTFNNPAGAGDTISYQLDVVKDAFPSISMESVADSTDERRIFFGGSISDDHGIRSFKFHYTLIRQDGSSRVSSEDLIISDSKTQEFYYFKDFGELSSTPGESVEYYFEVWDNDGVNGSKSTRSSKGVYRAPTESELDDARKESAESIKNQLEKSMASAQELQRQIDELNKELQKDNELDWQDKKKVEEVLEKRNELEQDIESMKQLQKKAQQNQQNFMQMNERILEKQERLERMFDELMSDEMKEMYERLEEMLENLDQDKLMEELEKMEMSAEQLEKELDRNLEIFKQLEVEQDFEKNLEKLKDLAEKQQELSEESKDKKADQEELKERQNELNKEFEEMKEDLAEMREKNQDLEQPLSIPDTEEKEKEIEEQMKESSEQLEQGKNKKASESQDGASDDMQEMADQMESSMKSGQSQSAQENMEDLRALLENIIQLSFDQEDVMEKLKYLERDDPSYIEMGRVQRRIKDDSKMVEDSLFALSKRVPQIESIVNKEIADVNSNIAKALEDIGERRTANAAGRQQYVMTSYNNLALLLDEALRQMQLALANQMPGKGNCENPGGKGNTPSPGNMGKMQDEMGKRLEEMMKKMEQGQQGGKPGFKPGMGNQGMSKEIAKMAAEQAAIRKEIEKMANELNEQGKGEGNGLKEIAQDMEELEKDLVNQEITRESLKRQEDIMIRLLESEKAMREREYDNKRESETPGSFEPSNPENYLRYKERKSREVELLRTVPADLRPYYRQKVNDYFLNFENNN